MNIFFLALNPRECAEMHADKHVVKMILESAQLLCTAHRLIDGTEGLIVSASGRMKKYWALGDVELDTQLYAATHVNHPSALWARNSKHNYLWLYDLFVALLGEYTHRYGKVHASDRLRVCLGSPPQNIECSLQFEPPWPAMPDEYKVAGDVIQSYRSYYLGAKRHLLKWKNRDPPEWVIYMT